MTDNSAILEGYTQEGALIPTRKSGIISHPLYVLIKPDDINQFNNSYCMNQVRVWCLDTQDYVCVQSNLWDLDTID